MRIFLIYFLDGDYSVNNPPSKFEKFSKIPHEFTAHLPFIQITANKKIFIDGCEGILEYQDDIVRINTGTFILLVKGRRLYIKCMTATSITLCGYISGVEFLK